MEPGRRDGIDARKRLGGLTATEVDPDARGFRGCVAARPPPRCVRHAANPVLGGLPAAAPEGSPSSRGGALPPRTSPGGSRPIAAGPAGKPGPRIATSLADGPDPAGL